jgi:hypothetical protein
MGTNHGDGASRPNGRDDVASLRCPVPVRSSPPSNGFRLGSRARSAAVETLLGGNNLTIASTRDTPWRSAPFPTRGEADQVTEARALGRSGSARSATVSWRGVQRLLRRGLHVMPHVAARVTTAIPAVEGLQPHGRLQALTLRTERTRLGLPTIAVVRLTHSYVPRCAHVRLRRSARVTRRRSRGPVRRLNACRSFALRGQ